MKLLNLISRADIETLQDLLGKNTVTLINQLDNKNFSSTKLQQVLQNVYSQSFLIKNKKTKNILFDLLKEEEVKQLLSLLNKSATGDVWKQIKEINITKNNQNIYYDYFEIQDFDDAYVKLPDTQIVEPKYSLFDHQVKASVETIKLLHTQEKHRAILHMPTGSGKTRTAMHVIANYLCKKPQTVIIWLAYSEELCEQATQEFIRSWQYLGNRNINTYRFWGNKNIDNIEQAKDGFIVAGLPKMVGKAKKSIEFMQNLSKNTSLVVIDEAHQAVAPTYSVVLDLLAPEHKNTQHLLGLTATPGRTWLDITEDEKLSDFFFRQKYSLSVDGFDNPIDYLVKKCYLAKAEFEPLYFNFGDNLTQQDIDKINKSIDIPQDILGKIADDAQRNILIIQKIIELLKESRRIIVFASTVEHSKLLSSVLRYKGVNAKSVTGDTPKQDRDNIINGFREDGKESMVICNYAVLTTGFDAPKTNVAVIARPTKSLVLYSQMVGRAIRGTKAGGNKKAKIVTVMDKNLGGFGNVAEAFNNWNDVWGDK